MKLASIPTAIAIASTVLVSGCDTDRASLNPSGVLEAVEVNVSATLAGRVDAVRIREGGRVAAGDTLIEINPDLIRLQIAQTAANRRSIAAQRRVLDGSIAAADRQLVWLDTALARARALLPDAATRNQIDELTTKRDLAALQLQTAQAQQSALDAEETKLDAALSLLERQLEECVVVAPLDGEVLLRSIEPGETALPGATLLRIADLAHLEMRVFLESGDLDRVRLGGSLPVIVDALPGDTLAGTVSWVSAEAEFTPKNVQTRNARAQLVYAVKVAVPNPDGKLKIGMPGEVIIRFDD